MVEPAADTGDEIAIVGAGSIGVAFAIVFARAGFKVRLFDPDPARRDVALDEVTGRLADLVDYDLLAEPVEAVVARIAIVADLADCIAGAGHVQECAPEARETKRRLYADLDRHARADAVLAGSSSAIPMSDVAADLAGRHRCLIAHPANPPYLITPIEVVPAPFTDETTVERTRALLVRAGLQPIVEGKEVEGFAFNRLQGALLREAYCLVRDGVVTVDDVDRMVRDGLGLRWSVVGPFETADLNTRGGIAAHAEKLGPAYARMGAERGQNDPWTPGLVAEVTAARRLQLPLSEWEERVAWRDRQLMALLRHRAEAGS